MNDLVKIIFDEQLFINDKPLLLKKFFKEYNRLVTWKDVEYCLNNPVYFNVDLINYDGFTILNIPTYTVKWSHRILRDKKFIVDSVNSGCSFIINHYSYFNDFTNFICSNLEDSFDVDSDMHVYGGIVTNSGMISKSFRVHYDQPSNFIIQCFGKTRWKVFNNISSSLFATPLVDEHFLKKIDAPSQILIDTVLEEGDVLYIPSRMFHCAYPLEPRLSISIPCTPRTKLLTKFDRKIYPVKI